jgi:hypothetical protein
LGTERTIPFKEIGEIYFQPSERHRPASTVEVRLADGSLLKGDLLKLVLGRVTLRCEVTSLGTLDLGTVSEIHFPRPSGVYLSDLQPIGTKSEPVFAATPRREYKKDRGPGNADAPISVGGRPYAKGLGVHAPCELTYDLGGGYRKFAAVAALDDSSAGKGSVVFVVLVDGKEAFRSPLVAGALWGGDAAAHEVNVSVERARRITLRVEHGPDDDACDRAVWADARLFRE